MDRTPSRRPGHRTGRYRLHPAADPMTRRRVGDANHRGRLDRNLGPFHLREGLTAPGALALVEAADLIVADWDRQVAEGNIGSDVIAMYTWKVRGFVAVLTAQGFSLLSDVTPNAVLAWCHMRAPGTSTTHTVNTLNKHRSAIRSFFETAKCLGLTDANPAKNIDFPTRSGRFVGALTDGQVRQLKQTAQAVLGDTRTPVALAAVLCGATAQELAFLTVDDVDLSGGRFWASNGGYRIRDRWAPFTDQWCADAFTARVRELRATYGDDAGGVWLIYKPHPSQPTPTRQATAGVGLITRLMQKARVHQPGATRAESIREWLALTIFEETGSVEQVALRLGQSSLDAAAHIVGYDWLTTLGPSDPPPVNRRDSVAAAATEDSDVCGDDQGADA